MARPAAQPRSKLDVKRVQRAVAAPPPAFVEPCLATLRAAPPEGDKWIHEIKYDGYRTQARIEPAQVRMFTRRGYDWSDTFASVAGALRELRVKNAILDGEIVVPNESGIADFHRLQDDLASGRTDRLVYFAFDLLYLDGFDLREVQLVDRKALLASLLGGFTNTHVRLSEHLEADPAALFERACAMHLEGIISKDRTSAYRSGRQDSWVKVKCTKSDTFPIVAFVEKLGAKPRRIASLYLGRREGDRLLYAGKAQTGFRQPTLYELRERLDPYIRKTSPLSVPVKKPKATWVEPVLDAEIEYSSLTADHLLRAPVFKGLREDLAASRVSSSAPAKVSRAASVGRVPKENILQLLPDAVVPTREQLAQYWKKVAARALKHLARRPLKLVRHTRGTTFYHMGRLPPVAEGVRQLKVQKREGGEGVRLWVEDLKGLLGLVDMGAVELHPWNATVDDIEHPDILVFDLDPGSGIEWPFVVETAFLLRDLLKAEGLESWPKLTGGKGVHLMASLSGMTHDAAHQYSRAIAERVVAHDRARYTVSASMASRAGRLFIDYLRNGRGTTAVGAYSPRARPRFPIAAPVTWSELDKGVRPDAFTLFDPPAPAAKRRARRRSV